MLADPDALLAAYKFEADGMQAKWVMLILTCMGGTMIHTAVVMLALLGCGPKLRAALSRWQWGCFGMLLAATAIGNTVNALIAKDMPAEGGYVNLAPWYVGMALA